MSNGGSTPRQRPQRAQPSAIDTPINSFLSTACSIAPSSPRDKAKKRAKQSQWVLENEPKYHITESCTEEVHGSDARPPLGCPHLPRVNQQLALWPPPDRRFRIKNTLLPRPSKLPSVAGQQRSEALLASGRRRQGKHVRHAHPFQKGGHLARCARDEEALVVLASPREQRQRA